MARKTPVKKRGKCQKKSDKLCKLILLPVRVAAIASICCFVSILIVVSLFVTIPTANRRVRKSTATTAPKKVPKHGTKLGGLIP